MNRVGVVVGYSKLSSVVKSEGRRRRNIVYETDDYLKSVAAKSKSDESRLNVGGVQWTLRR